MAEGEDGGGLEDHPLHDLLLDVAVCLVELLHDGLGGATEDADPDLRFLEILSDLDIGHGHEFAVPFVILLDDGSDFTAEEFVDSIKAAGHGRY